MSNRDGGVGDGAGVRIACIHERRAAKRIAGKLVEQQDQRQRAGRRRQPAIQLAARRSFMGVPEPLVKAAVEIRILGEPERWAGLSPECDDSAGHCVGRRRLRPYVATEISAGMKFLFDETLTAFCRDGTIH